jgi:hypothetical protein
MLGKIVAGVLRDLGLGENVAWRSVATIKILTSHQRWFVTPTRAAQGLPHRVLESWLEDDEVQQFLHVNRYQSILWFNKEAFERLLQWMLLVAAVTIGSGSPRAPDEIVQAIARCGDVVQKLHQAKEESGYQVEKLLGATRK